jgi:hypothetical protein
MTNIPVNLTCDVCEKSDETVHDRICSYTKELTGKDYWETICDDCEHEHVMDI